MPKEGQKSVTIPEWVWNEAEEYFNEHKEELKYRNVTSITGLITLWILERKSQLKEEI